MSPGAEVLIFSISGTFKGAKGVITEMTGDSARVLLDGEREAMSFGRREIVPLEESTRHIVAGE